MVQAFNPSTQEAEADWSLSSKPTWSTERERDPGRPGLHRKTLSWKTKQTTTWILLVCSWLRLNSSLGILAIYLIYTSGCVCYFSVTVINRHSQDNFSMKVFWGHMVQRSVVHGVRAKTWHQELRALSCSASRRHIAHWILQLLLNPKTCPNDTPSTSSQLLILSKQFQQLGLSVQECGPFSLHCIPLYGPRGLWPYRREKCV